MYTIFIIQNSERLFQVLREWFDSVCDCDGLNNLYRPQVTCVDDTVGKIITTVHSDESNDKTAEMLIDLAKNDILRRNTAQVEVSSDWIVCLSEDCGKTDDGSGMSSITMQLYIKNISCKDVRKLWLTSANLQTQHCVHKFMRVIIKLMLPQIIETNTVRWALSVRS